ncbi:reverse transcriptase [Elysia marginata]|uniref:Reverse transcriptase n=1 Tax=Elysia marginata TaxID=1093978 RepID=A0AAV4FEA1_9GAST|nr:reverse transcriptase [Elysia marginata]
MLTIATQRTMRLRRPSVDLEIYYPCIRGEKFASDRGKKIQRTKMECVNTLFQTWRNFLADMTPENQGQVGNNCNSCEEIQAEDKDDQLRQRIIAKCHRLNFAATNAEQWEHLDRKRS